MSLSAQPREPTRLWHFDPSLDQYVLIRIVNGEQQVARFTPAIFIEPSITVEIGAMAEGFSFAYTISNGSRSRQPIRTCSFLVPGSAAVASTPMEWDSMSTPLRGRIAWIKLNRGGSLGVEPGESQSGYAIRSSSLPGIAKAECRGRIPGIEIPEWVGDDERLELDMLIERDFVTVPVIGPVISRAQTSTSEELLAAIGRHYADELRLWPDPYGEAVAARLRFAELFARQRRYDSALMIIDELLVAPPPSGEWSRQVVKGLHAGLLYVRERLHSK